MLKDFRKEEFDIIIQAGQSNSQGCGRGEVSEAYIPNNDVWYMNNDFSLSMAQERVIGNNIVGDFSLYFSKEYIEKGKLQPGRMVLILRTAIGGTGFSDNRWGITNDLFLTMMEMIETALSLNPKNKLVALLWHQGETDAMLKALYDVYFKNLLTLVDAVKSTFNCKDIPFIAGDFTNQWKMDNVEICEPIINAIKKICSEIGNAHFVETYELQSNDQKLGDGDKIHFCREALNQLGIKCFNSFSEITR